MIIGTAHLAVMHTLLDAVMLVYSLDGYTSIATELDDLGNCILPGYPNY